MSVHIHPFWELGAQAKQGRILGEKKWLLYKSGVLWKLEAVLFYTLSDTKSLHGVEFVRWQVHCKCSNN